jgi:hypothetical protein
MHLSKFVHSTTGRYMMSILLGIGLATFFRQTCIGNNCVIFSAPPVEEIDEQTYKFDKKCYKMVNSSVSCDNKKKIYSFT